MSLAALLARYRLRHAAYVPATSAVLDLGFNGANGSTTIPDVYGHTVTASGAVALSTTSPYEGSASCNFPGGASDYLSIPTDPLFAWGTADGAIEIPICPTTVAPSIQILCTTIDGLSLQTGFYFLLAGSQLQFSHYTASGTADVGVAGTGGTIVINTWQVARVEKVTTGGVCTYTLKIDGVVVGSGTGIANMVDSFAPLVFGKDPRNPGRVFSGKMDRARVFKGGIS